MTNLTLDITPNGAETQHKAKGAPNPNDPGHSLGNAAYLNQNDGITFAISGFDSGSEITEVHVYSDANETNQIGQWTRSGGATGLNGIFNIAASGANVTLSDAEAPGSNTDRWYKVKVATSSGKYWWMDPEVINKAGGNKTGGATWGSSTT